MNMNMNKTKRLAFVLTAFIFSQTAMANPIDFIFGAGSFGRQAGTTADCRNVIKRYVENRRFLRDETWRDRTVPVRNPQFLDDLEYLEDTRYASSTLGIVDTRFVEEFDTQIYFTATGRPLSDGTIPVVDPEAKALVVYLHGSGTKKASGVGFAGKMNSLAKMGYSSLSFDMPFHALGSRNPALANAANYAEYMNRIIERYRVPNQKVILVGHSFGPDVIAEYITRYPRGVDSAVLISPGSFDHVTKKWYEEKTSRMDFGETEMNDAGGRWAGMVTRENTWNRVNAPGRVDPTVANRDLDIYVISGDREEYVPGPLDSRGHPTDAPRTYDVAASFQRYFSRVDVTIEPGVGHYIFNHRDAHGHDVVLRSVLRANGESLAQEKELRRVVTDRMAQRPAYDLMALRYSKEPFFRAYVDRLASEQGKSGMEIIQGFRQSDDRRNAQQMMTNFMTVERQRVEALNTNIRNTAQWAPDFYRENRAAIVALGEKGNDQTTIQAKYLALLEGQPREVVRQHASVPESVYVIPERGPGPATPGAVAVAIPPEMKANIMRDPELKAYVVSQNSAERNDVVSAIATLKMENPNLNNQEVIRRVRELRGGN